ncbi:MAG TPA: SRPBCC domain-containing protein [Gaiellaceae bacterium]|jgi:uncharacterized protein YndB with AHSA1/START domain
MAEPEPESTELTLHLERVLPAPPAVVFEAFVEPEKLTRWWGPKGFTSPSIQLEPENGGTYRIAMQPPDGDLFHLSGEFREIVAPARLAYTFRWDEPTPDDRETLVTLSLRDQDGSTGLSLDQGAFATEERLALHEQGWTESLDRLEELISGGFVEPPT